MMFEVIAANDEHNSEEFTEIFQKYHRGLNNGPEGYSFNESTFLASVASMALLYGPIFIIVIIFSFRFFGCKDVYENLIENSVLFVFPLFTNLSFYNKTKINGSIDAALEPQTRMLNFEFLDDRVSVRRTQSVPNLNQDCNCVSDSRRFRSSLSLTPEITMLSQPTLHSLWKRPKLSKHKKPDQNKRIPSFSLVQSNILYFFFLSSNLILLGADVALQIIINRTKICEENDPECKNISYITKTIFGVIVFNLLLWIDFVSADRTTSPRPVNQQQFGFESLLQDSNNTLFCLILAPVIWCQSIRRYVNIHLSTHTLINIFWDRRQQNKSNAVRPDREPEEILGGGHELIEQIIVSFD